MEKLFKNKGIYLFTAILILGILIRVLLFSGLQGSDDLQYIDDAHQFLTNGFSAVPDDSTKMRLLLYIPVSLSFHLFGINEISAVLYPFLCSVGMLILVYQYGRLLFNQKIALVAMLLYAFYPIEVTHATMIYPEIAMDFFLGLSVYCYLRHQKSETSNPLLLCAAGALVGCAYLVKITAILIFGVYFIYFILNKNKIQHWFYFTAGLVGVLLIETLFYYTQTGDLLFQYHLLSNIVRSTNAAVAAGANDLNIYRGRFMGLYRAFVYYPGIMLATPYNFSFYFYGVGIAILYSLWKKLKSTYPLILWFSIILLGLNFGFKGIRPLIFIPSAPRYLMTISIPMVLLLGYLFGHASTKRWKKLSQIALIIFLITTTYFLQSNYAHGSPKTSHNSREIYIFLQNKEETVYIDERTKRNLEFLSGYQNNFQLMLFGSDTKDETIELLPNSYVVINKHWINRMQLWSAENFPQTITSPPEHWHLVKHIENPYRELNVGIISTLKRLIGTQSNAAAEALELEEDSDAYIYYIPAME